jgi:hypothetical protein
MESHRSCDRPGCGAEAAAALTFHYDARTAWLDDLGDRPEPSIYELCARHADGLRVPLGWAREDRRHTIRSVYQPPIAS